MLKWLRKRFKRDEKGQGMVEYGLILALVSVVAIFSLTDVGTTVKGMFTDIMGSSGIVGGGGSSGPNDKGGRFTEGGIYTEEEINKMVTVDGYIPIATSQELDNLRHDDVQVFGRGTPWERQYSSGLSGKYVQVSDIDMSSFDYFTPISGNSDYFRGVFDGSGRKIKNVYIDVVGSYVGLFGRSDGSTLTNIGLENVDVTGTNEVGGLVGSQNNSTIENSYVTGQVSGSGSNIGGLVGHSSSSSVSKTYSTGNVSGGNRVGGLVGYNRYLTVSNSYATGEVTGDSRVGGLIGGNGERSLIKDSGWASDVNSGLQGIGDTVHGGRTSNVVGQSKVEIDELIDNLINSWTK